MRYAVKYQIQERKGLQYTWFYLILFHQSILTFVSMRSIIMYSSSLQSNRYDNLCLHNVRHKVKFSWQFWQLWPQCCCISYFQFAEAGPLFCTALAGAACIIIGMVSTHVHVWMSTIVSHQYELWNMNHHWM